jgi:Bacterial PH domain
VVLGVVVMSVLSVVFTVRSGESRWLFLSLPFTLVLLVIGRFAPTGYRLAGDGIHVERRAKPYVIPYRAIRDADQMARPVAGLSVMGSRGIFGRFGRFWNARLGFYRLFLSNGHRVVWLTTDDGWVGLSPDRPDEFIARLRARL